MKRLSVIILLSIGLLLAACSSAPLLRLDQPAIEPTVLPPNQPAQPVSNQATQLAELTDGQGAVTVIVKPLDLNRSADTLSFEVALDTHAIDLSMDLAALATLTTDTGQSVQAILWDAPLGGHHVSGTLSFPASVENKPILDGASKLTLIIKNVDAPERTFVWNLK